jgi:glycosyltransferase involved in cell wall biosynthesis
VESLLQPFTITQLIALATVAFATLIQSCYYLCIYLRPVLWKQKQINNIQEPLSVIICARNESENLRNFLPKILEQQYPEFEVIVVNDCSEDDTETLLAEMQLKHKHLKFTTIEPDRKFSHGKKLALTIGMKAATYNRLVFTDADCYPVSDQWLQEYSKSYAINKQIILAYGGYENQKGLLNKLIRFDSFFIAMQYIGFAMAGRPYMGVGRNLSYLKSIFFKGKGFSKHYKLISGDDDLFVNENSQKANTATLLTPNSFTHSIPQTTFLGWVKQKKRHLTTGKLYKTGDKFYLATEPFSRLLFYVGIIMLIVLKVSPIIVVGIFGFRFLLQLLVIKLNMNKFDEKGFCLLTPVFDIILPIFHLFFIISNQLNNRKSKWK